MRRPGVPVEEAQQQRGESLQAVRNIKPGFKRGLWFGLANAALETALRGHTPWTLQHVANENTLKLLDANHLHDPPPPSPPENALPPRDRTAAVYLASTAQALERDTGGPDIF